MGADPRARTIASLALLMVSGVLFVLGFLALYARAELVDPESFSDRAVSALEDDDVRQVVAEEIVNEIIDQGASDLLTVRPLLTSGVTALLDTPQFEQLYRAAVRDAHQLFLERGDGDLVVDLANTGTLVAEGLASVSPRIAADLPDDLRPQVVELRESDFAAQVVRASDNLRVLAVLLPLLAFAGFAAAVAIAPSHRAALTGVGVAIATGGAAVAIALLAWRALIVDSVDQSGLLQSDDVRAAVRAVWDAYLNDLRVWAFAAFGFGLLLIAVGGTGARPAGAFRTLLQSIRPLLLEPRTRAARIARALAAMVVGVFVIYRPDYALEMVAVAAGAGLVLFGVEELVAALERARVEPKPGARRRRAVAALAGATGVFVLGLGAVGVAAALRSNGEAGGGGGEEPAERRPVDQAACNGAVELCDRRLNQLTFAGTHNSYSAAREPGWLFANQQFGIARQLEDGIRRLELDVHYGVPTPDGVRTDLSAEGESRNKAARALDPRALRVADRLAGRVGFGSLGGAPRLYLCHTLCELGAEPFIEELETIRTWLERNPRDVLQIFVESYVPAEEIERAFEEAGLLDRLATLRRDEPLPTLGELVEANRRVVVFSDADDAGSPRWYHPAYSFFQDTKIRFAAEGRCERRRGDENSPMLLLNHWVDSFPPSPRENRKLGTPEFIEETVRRCERRLGLTPNVISVDFYDRSDVIEVSRELSRR